MDNLKARVENSVIEVKKGIEPHINESNFITDGWLDSLDIMNLIMKLEEEFDIEIDPEDVLSENFESIEKIMALVDKCQN